ncbi:unnamed protein product [Amoebophrya sp. A25]|nr:unnamed protein product [Amoebophrya sp. A25]|eukprot:GSA25T00008309001.1
MDPREKLIEDLLAQKRSSKQGYDDVSPGPHVDQDHSPAEDEWGQKWSQTEDLVKKLLAERAARAGDTSNDQTGDVADNANNREQRWSPEKRGGAAGGRRSKSIDPLGRPTPSSSSTGPMIRGTSPQEGPSSSRGGAGSAPNSPPRADYDQALAQKLLYEGASFVDANTPLGVLAQRAQAAEGQNPRNPRGPPSGPQGVVRRGQVVRGPSGGASTRPNSRPPGRGGPQQQTNKSKSSGASNGGIPLEDRASLWARQHKRKLEQRGKLKQEKETKELANCTFRPNADRPSSKTNDTTRAGLEFEESAEQMFERLHHEADQRSKIREKAKSLLQDTELQELTFQPQLQQGSASRKRSQSAAGYKPLKDRVAEVQRRKEEKLLQAQLEVEKRENATFKPKLSAASERMIQKKREEALRMVETGQDVDGEATLFVQNASERLYQVGKRKSQEQAFMEQQATHPAAIRGGGGSRAGSRVDQTGMGTSTLLGDLHDQDLQSGGVLAPKTEEIVKNSVFFQGPCADFLTRQQTFEDARTQRRELRRKIADSDLKFQPTISKVSEALARTNVKRLNESEKDRIDRMSTVEVQRREQLKQRLASEIAMQDCTFQPKINPVSTKIREELQREQMQRITGGASELADDGGMTTGRTGDDGASTMNASSVLVGERVHERLYREAAERLKEATSVISEKEMEFKKAYTFKPEIRPISKTKKESLYAQDKKEQLLKQIADTQRRRELEIERKKKEIEDEKNKDCTFQPSRGTRPPKLTAPVVVNGLSRFLEMKEAAKKKADEERAAQEAAWGMKPKGLLEKRCGGVTIPAPFRLSETREGRRMLRAEFEAERRLQEYTFKPRTLEGARAAQLERILSSRDPYVDEVPDSSRDFEEEEYPSRYSEIHRAAASAS